MTTKERATAKSSKPVRRRDAPETDKPTLPKKEKDTQMISCSFKGTSCILTRADYQELKSYMAHGELSRVIRSALKRWLLEKRQEAKSKVKALLLTDNEPRSAISEAGDSGISSHSKSKEKR